MFRKHVKNIICSLLVLWFFVFIPLSSIANEKTVDSSKEFSYWSAKITMAKGHLYSDWIFNGVKGNVFLESAFPKVVFDESFIKKNNSSLKFDLKPAPDNMKIAFWGAKKTHKVSYIFSDSVVINGNKLWIDALVVDLAKVDNQKRDIIFPIDLLNCGAEINIKKKYIKLFDPETYNTNNMTAYDISIDTSRRRRLYLIEGEIYACSKKDTATLKGNFLLDLGAGNTISVNKNNDLTSSFLKQAYKTQSTTPHVVDAGNLTNVTVIMPDYLYFDKFLLPIHTFISAMTLQTYGNDSFNAILGNHFFEHFIIAFDFVNNKFYLRSK